MTGSETKTPDGNMLRGYQQVYLVKQMDTNIRGYEFGVREVFFRCGNWCYSGEVTFNFLSGEGQCEEKDINLSDIPRVIPTLQRQQDNLSLLCSAESVPLESGFQEPLAIMDEAQEFIASELTSDRICKKLNGSKEYSPWLDNERNSYFELVGDIASSVEGVQCMCSKTYARGLIFITIYFEGVFYVVIRDGDGDQPLLDIKFPDISKDLEGLTLALYDSDDKGGKGLWRKLSIWQSLAPEVDISEFLTSRETKMKNLSSTMYMQTYCILKSSNSINNEKPTAVRDVLFRFGSWCYAGEVQLVPKLSLSDLPHVIPALRIQQSRLDFLCEAGQLPSKSVFSKPMEYATRAIGVMENELSSSEDALCNLISRLAMMGLGESANQWIDGDPNHSFFEFTFAQDKESSEAHKDIELMATKCYNPNGLITMAIYFENMYYLCVNDGEGEQSLLDCKFPDIATKGQGYQIRSYPSGVEDWPQLRKMSVWQNASAMDIGGSAGSKEVEEEKLEVKASDQNDFKDCDILCEQMSFDLGESKDLDVSLANKSVPDKEIESASFHKEGENVSCTMAEGKEDAFTNHKKKSKSKTRNAEKKKSRTSMKDVSSAKNISEDRGMMQNLGAFHHLAPMKKTSNLESQLGNIKKAVDEGNHGGDSEVPPWDKRGVPLLGK